VDEIVNYVVKNGTIQPQVLFETPFSNFHDQGVVGIFGTRAKEIVELVDYINAHAGIG
jgi:type I restriction enzyme R subunit